MLNKEMGINTELLRSSTKVTMDSNDYYKLLQLASYGMMMKDQVKTMGTYTLSDSYHGRGVKSLSVDIPVLDTEKEQIAVQLAERIAADENAIKACVYEGNHYYEHGSHYLGSYNWDNDKIDLRNYPVFRERYDYWKAQKDGGVELFPEPVAEEEKSDEL